MVVMVLAAAVALEAVPAALWFQSRFTPGEPIVSAASQPPAPAPVALATAAPCTPTAEPAAAPVAAAPKAPPPRPAAAGLVAGLVSIAAPVPMHVYADGRLVGTTDSETIMLPVGEHDLELVSDSMGFRARKAVVVQAGRTASLEVESPRVPVHVNAIPWAEVWIDNQRVGETPIGNLQQTIGPHEVVFRHPELGERRMVAVVTLKEPARISMDMRKR
jgi:hypothetical protein